MRLKSNVLRQNIYTPNISLTYGCNINCQDCFQIKIKEKFPLYMSIRNFYKIIKWLKKQKIDAIGLWGGEPTTHPKFLEILDICRKERMKVWIYTNNFFDDSIMKKLTNDYIYRIRIHYSPSFSKQPNYSQYNKNLADLYKKNIKFTFCCTLPEKGDYSDLVEKLKRYNTFAEAFLLCPLETSNQKAFLRKLKILARGYLKILKYMNKNGVKFISRVPVPICFFSDKEWKYLKKHHMARGRCYEGEYHLVERAFVGYSNHIAINPDLSVFPCIISFLKGPSILSFKNISELDDYLKNSFWEKWRWDIHLMEKCRTCEHSINKRCSGGCLIYKYKNVHENKLKKL